MPLVSKHIIAEKLLQRIQKGEFDEQSFLPSERQLAEQLNCSRSLIRAAFQELQKQAVLRLIPGRGAVVQQSCLKPRLERFLVCLHQLGKISNHAYELFALLSGICIAASDIYAEAILSFSESEELAENLINRFHKRDIQGVIFIEQYFDDAFMEKLANAGVPCVIANDEQNSKWLSSKMNFRGIGRMAGKYLLENGHKKIAVLAGSLKQHIFSEMLAGFRGALAEEEIYIPAELIAEVASGQESKKMRQILTGANRPDAVFVMRDGRAAQLYKLCEELQIGIPDDLSVISYDDISWPDAKSAGLTSIAQPVNEIGRNAVSLIEQWYKEGKMPDSKVLQGCLQIRNSVKNLRANES